MCESSSSSYTISNGNGVSERTTRSYTAPTGNYTPEPLIKPTYVAPLYTSRSYGSPSFVRGTQRRPVIKPNCYKPTVEGRRQELRRTGKLGFNVFNEANRKSHHTDRYGVDSLVVRRGAPFDLGLTFPGKAKLQQLVLSFSTGTIPQENKDTEQRFILKTSAEKGQVTATSMGSWQARLTDSGPGGVTVQITTSPDAVVGAYIVQVTAKVKTENDNDDEYSDSLDKPVYILFNAWCKGDDVYMEDDRERDEYVMNESGRVYRGSTRGNQPVGVPWTFGQFSKYCLRCAIILLDKSAIAKHRQGNAVMVIRAISAMVNSSDDNGIVWGKWEGQFSDGTAPTEWVSSISIIEKYLRYNKPVKYGQCWVFSAVCVTVCRALGIPCRSVTNYNSAHDSDESMTVDSHFDAYGCRMGDAYPDDSVWNFHVWNEAWMQRDDLPDGYGGWQAFDATPQESSEGRMQCGPASVKAIKAGDVFLNYDVKFIFAEVNADRLVWICDQSTGTMYPVRTELETKGVGEFISTKAVGSNDRNDITRDYKYKEGSAEERRTVEKATRFACAQKKQALKANVYSSKEDVKFGVEATVDGGDLTVDITFNNKSDEMRTGFVRVNATANYYTGTTAEVLDNKNFDFVLKPSEDKVGRWQLPASKYLNDIDEDANVKIVIVGRIKETGQYFVREKVFEVDKDEINVQVSNSRPRVGQEFDVTVSFKNPFKVALRSGVIHLEGPGIQKDFTHRIRQPIGPMENYTQTFSLRPKYPGKKEIVVSFKCRQPVTFTGAAEVHVQ